MLMEASETTCSGANNYIVVISDGEPTFFTENGVIHGD
jgi:hypothetical protein